MDSSQFEFVLNEGEKVEDEDEATLYSEATTMVEDEEMIVEGERVIVEGEGTMVEAEGTMVEGEGAMVEAEEMMVESEGTMVEGEGTTVKGERRTMEAEGRTVEAEGTAMEGEGMMVEGEGMMVEKEGAGQNTAKYKAVRNNYCELVTSFQNVFSHIIAKLFEKHLITTNENSYAKKAGASCGILLDCILGGIELDAGKYDVFFSILQEFPSLECVTETVEISFESLQQNNLSGRSCSLVPSPFSRGERKWPGIHCLRMCKISLEFQGTVFFSNRFRILNTFWRWSSISLACGCGYARELWRLLLSVLLFPLLLPSP